MELVEVSYKGTQYFMPIPNPVRLVISYRIKYIDQNNYSCIAYGCCHKSITKENILIAFKSVHNGKQQVKQLLRLEDSDVFNYKFYNTRDEVLKSYECDYSTIRGFKTLEYIKNLLESFPYSIGFEVECVLSHIQSGISGSYSIKDYGNRGLINMITLENNTYIAVIESLRYVAFLDGGSIIRFIMAFIRVFDECKKLHGY